jgi:hypothetical protein
MVWVWYAIGAVLGALQLGLPIAQGKRETAMPILFASVAPRLLARHRLTFAPDGRGA